MAARDGDGCDGGRSKSSGRGRRGRESAPGEMAKRCRRVVCTRDVSHSKSWSARVAHPRCSARACPQGPPPHPFVLKGPAAPSGPVSTASGGAPGRVGQRPGCGGFAKGRSTWGRTQRTPEGPRAAKSHFPRRPWLHAMAHRGVLGTSRRGCAHCESTVKSSAISLKVICWLTNRYKLYIHTNANCQIGTLIVNVNARRTNR